MILRFLHPQGIAGLAAALSLVALLLLQKGETRHWRRQSGQFEQLYRGEQAAFAGTVANYRAASDAARAADKAAAERVRADQIQINERTQDAFQTRLADARAHADRLRLQAGAGSTDPGTGRAATMPGLSAASGGIAQAAGENRLPDADSLVATEQAIQLDELIKWVKAQARVGRD